MKQLKTILILVMLGLLVLGLSSCGANGTNIDKDKKDVNVDKNTDKSDNSLLDKVKDTVGGFGSGQKCVLTEKDGDEESTTTVYLHDKELKIEIVFKDTEYSHTDSIYQLIKDNKIYMWSEKENGGISAPLEDDSGEFTLLAHGDFEGYKKSMEADGFKCTSWNYDSKVFELPSDDFNDISDAMKAFEQQMNEACAQCDTLSGDEKTACQKMACY